MLVSMFLIVCFTTYFCYSTIISTYSGCISNIVPENKFGLTFQVDVYLLQRIKRKYFKLKKNYNYENN